MQVKQLEQELAALEPDSDEYNRKQAELDAAKEQARQAEAALPSSLAPAQQRFNAVLSPVLNLAKQGIDAQIAALDPSAVDYAEQVAKLEAQKSQLDTLPATLPMMASGLGQLAATSVVLEEQQAGTQPTADGNGYPV